MSLKPKSHHCRFLVAELQLPYLAEQTNKQNILSALNRLPRGLEKTYDVSVSRITAQSNLENVALARTALMWLTFTREPLQTMALQHALTVKDDTLDIGEGDLPNVQMLVSLCMGLVAIEQESGTIRLVHETTQQYLESYFRKAKEDGDSEIAKACLHYLSFPAFSRGFQRTGSTLSGHFEGDPLLNEHIARYPLSGYASRYWFVHVKRGSEETLVPLILKTFQSQSVRDSVARIANYSQFLNGFESRRPLSHLLHIASRHGLSILCREILRPKNDVQTLYLVLHCSAKSRKTSWGNPLKVSTIIEAIWDLELRPLHLAALFGHIDVVELLLEKGASRNPGDRRRETPLHLAVRSRHIKVVKLLLEKGASRNPRSQLGYTPLHLAAKSGHIEVVKLLLEKGASRNPASCCGHTPLHLAVESGHIETVRLLLEQGAKDLRDQMEETPLHLAARSGQLEVVRLLLEKRKSRDPKNSGRYTPLHLAVQSGCIEVVRLLLEEGASRNPGNWRRQTPLHLAAGTGYAEVVGSLLEKGANINAQDEDKETPLHLAAHYGKVDVVRLLLEKGANTEVKNERRLCPLEVVVYASEKDSRRLEQMDTGWSERAAAAVRILENWKGSNS
jgi:ankyrin repeat protein